jgi:hypothetical protein
MTDDHFFSVFCTIRFKNSVRNSYEFLSFLEERRKYYGEDYYEEPNPII